MESDGLLPVPVVGDEAGSRNERLDGREYGEKRERWRSEDGVEGGGMMECRRESRMRY